MKTYYIIGIILLFTACVSERIIGSKHLIKQIGGKQITEEQKNIAADIKKIYFHSEPIQTKSFPLPILKAAARLEDYKLYTLPYYLFDNKQFNENPTEENLLNCIKPVDAINTLAEQNGQIDARFLLEKEENGHWAERIGTDSYGRVIEWLKDSLKNGNITDFKIFGQGYGIREFVTYKKEEEVHFFRITGEPSTASGMCKYFIQEHELSKEYKEFKKNNPDFLNKIDNKK